MQAQSRGRWQLDEDSEARRVRLLPQMADAAEVYAGIAKVPGISYPVLVPNEQGYERARAVGADDVAGGCGSARTSPHLPKRAKVRIRMGLNLSPSARLCAAFMRAISRAAW